MSIARLNPLAACLAFAALSPASDRAPDMPMPVVHQNSAEHAWRAKPVLASRLLDPTSGPATWAIRGNGILTFPEDRGPMDTPRLRVDVDLHFTRPATGNGLPAVNLRRAFPGEDWSAYNRLSFWVRADIAGFPVLSLGVVLRNDGKEKVPDVYQREGLHYVTIPHGRWTRVQWEITSLARDKIVAVDFSPWVNKRLADPSDRFAFEIARVELERVAPDHYEGWNVAPGRIAFSHSGYQPATSKTALASGLTAREFTVLRDDTGEPVWRGPVATVKTRIGEFQTLDFTGLREPGAYTIDAGGTRTRPFRIGSDAWRDSIWKTLNFFYGERCGMAIPGIHDACHRDWQAVQGDRKIVMNGGWHDAGDLSQGLINTAEAAYAMFALAERTPDPVLRARLIEEARWGLDWVLKVRFEGGFRIGFASMNLWTNGIIGDADDRTREALNNPNVNYLAATAEAIAYRVLKDADPQLAARALRTAEDDWRYAVEGRETPENLSTPAFAATEMELAAVGVLASVELYRATGKQVYADKSRELARVVMASQQRTYVGSRYPLAGFFYNGPDKKGIFRQFHRANDQAPAVAMAALCEAFPDHPDWIRWYATAALYGEYQKRAAATTEPWGVLPAYIYKDDEWKSIPERDRYESSREAFREQVLRGMPMGDGYYLRAFPVWFARRGNYGVLLSQAKGLSAAARLRRDRVSAELATRQLEWVVGRNPFVQSTMWGEGYDFAPQYTLSSGDIVGSLPVGMQTRANNDLPYWPAQNGFVYKEVWVHPSARWLWLMEDLLTPVEQPSGFRFTSETANGEVTLRVEGKGTYEIRADNLKVERAGALVWKGRVANPGGPWVAVAIPDGDVARRAEIVGGAPNQAGVPR